MRVVIADDSGLLRDGLSLLLSVAGIAVEAMVGNGDDLIEAVMVHRPDVAMIDIRMPPTFTTEGAEAAAQLRRTCPSLGILLLSQVVERRFALELARAHPTGFGYLLKDRVVNVATLVDALERVAMGGTVLDPDVVSHFLGRQDVVQTLTVREREVLALMAEGQSNQAIATGLFVSEKTVETHIAAIFAKLDLPPEPGAHRRVLAVRKWLDS